MDVNKLKLKWYGTASVLLEQNGTRLLFDPFMPINNKLYKTTIEEFSASEHIFVTHGHYDHISGIPKVVKYSTADITVYCTKKPFDTLIKKGVEKRFLHKIAPGDCLRIEPFKIHVLKGKHIIFDKWLIIKTLCSPRILTNRGNLKQILKNGKDCDEAGETVVYDICTDDKRILLLGSLNLDDSTEYPKSADLLVLPLQGRSDISKYAMDFIRKLQPKKVLLDHFDDSFPPISSAVDTTTFVSNIKQKHPDIRVICPQASSNWIDLW